MPFSLLRSLTQLHVSHRLLPSFISTAASSLSICRCWSSCPCQGRGFDPDRASDGGRSPASHRLWGVPGASPEAMIDGLLSCRVCAVLQELCHQVEELWQEVSRLCSFRKDERQTGSSQRDSSFKSPEPQLQRRHRQSLLLAER